MECKNDISEKAKDANTGPRIVLNTYFGNKIEGEAFVTDHIFSYILQGKQDVWLADQKHSYHEGDFRFFRRNQLTKYVKSTTDGRFRSIAVHIDQYTLKDMSEQYGLKADSIINPQTTLLIQSSALLKGFVDSLVPYLRQQMDERIVALKARELVLLLIQHNPAFKNVLFDFNEPGKIDLEAFMNSHYRYNVPMERFAFLTGRSISGFKRDFEKQFHTSPGRWLLQKRLDAARFLIEQQKKKSSDVYLDLGFEDLSHFSFAYKKEFGYAPNKKQS